MTTTTTPAVLTATVTLTTGNAIYITGVASSQTIVRQAVFTSIAAIPVGFTVHRVPAASSPGTSNVVINARIIPPGWTDLAPELVNLVLNAGDTIQCAAGAGASINFTASGYIST